MFNEITLKDIETIDTIISERNKSLWSKMIFLSWTFPTNHSHEIQTESSNYFCIWIGRTGEMSLKLVFFGGIWVLPKLLSEVTDEQLFEILDRNDLKNWKIQAKDKSDALEQFKQKANIGEKTKLRNLKIIERGQEKI